MTRLVVPFPILLIALLVSAGVLAIQSLVHLGAAALMGEEVWVGECAPHEQRVSEGGTLVELVLSCNGEETTTQDAGVIVAWINDQRPVHCSKEAYWNSADVSWDCRADEKPE